MAESSSSVSNGWHPGQSPPSPSASRKGKGKATEQDVSAAEAFLSKNGEESGPLHGGTDQSYKGALQRHLGTDEQAQSGRRNGSDGEDRFTYDGVDDEDANGFREETKTLDREEYNNKLKDYLEEDAPPASPAQYAIDEAVRPEVDVYRDKPPISITQPDSPPPIASPRTPTRTMTPPSSRSPRSPTFSVESGQHSPSYSSLGDYARYRTEPPQETIPRLHPLGVVPRRPPMNPLVSRLRSTSGAPTLSNSASLRSLSQVSSLVDFRDKNGFADASPSSSFILDQRDIGQTSRLSSMANIHDILTRRVTDTYKDRRLASQNPSELGFTPGSPSPAASIKQPALRHPEVAPLRWTTLRNISARIFAPKRVQGSNRPTMFGDPTAIATTSLICIGTSKGYTLVFDYSQTLKCVCGNDTIASASGKVTALAVSSDQTFVAVGHITGHIFLYALAKPNVPARTVNPTTFQLVQQGRAEGHLSDHAPITFLGFVGGRHTAIYSGDSSGLAFYHSLGKVLGLANTDTLRILGKYPPTEPKVQAGANGTEGSSNAPASLLAMQPLALGTQPHPTDDYSLVALLTGQKLVVAGLKPSARTWWRCINRDLTSETGEEYEKHRSGSLAWLPSIHGSEPVVAFSWANKLRIVRLKQHVKKAAMTSSQQNGRDGKRPPKDAVLKTLKFEGLTASGSTIKDEAENVHPVFESESPIVAMQWINPKSLALLTSTHLEIFDIASLQRTDSLVLAKENISPALSLRCDQALQTYKGKIFLAVGPPKSRDIRLSADTHSQTTNGLRVGTLLSWADRVLQLVDSGDLVSAIELATSYYNGTATPLTANGTIVNSNLGLPSDETARKRLVEPRLRDILMASMEYVFSEDRMKDSTHEDPTGLGRGVDRTSLFETLVDSTARACIAVDNSDFLFEELYERYSAEGIEGIFLDRIEPFILDRSITQIPTHLVQQLLTRHEGRNELQQAEDLIWHVKPECLDVNQAVTLCSKHRLYNAMIYVYTQALSDFVGPFVELLKIVRLIWHQRNAGSRWLKDSAGADETILEHDTSFSMLEEAEALVPDAYIIYAYLADSLVGLTHPTREALSEEAALNAKVSLYTFLFSGRPRTYPEGSSTIIYTCEGEEAQESIYPYIRLLLRFDTEATLDCLDIALEDSYLNEEATGRTLDRQQILNVLIDIMGSSTAEEFTTTDRTFLNIFVARNIPKYAQFVQLAPPTLDKILLGLASDSDLSTREDRQLASEYLLSAYTPAYDQHLLDVFEKAGFYRVLASRYKATQQWKELAAVYIKDSQNGDTVLQNLTVLLTSVKDKAHKAEVASEILQAIPQLAEYDVWDTAALVNRYMPDKHTQALATLHEAPLRQLGYLRSLLEPELDEMEARVPQRKVHLPEDARYLYLSLLCEYDTPGASRFIDQSKDMNPDSIIKILNEREIFEAVVHLQASTGHVGESLKTADSILKTRSGLITATMAEGSLDFDKYTRQVVNVSMAAIQVCEKHSDDTLSDISTDNMWYSLLSSLVDVVKTLNMTARLADVADDQLGAIRELIPSALSALISSTSSRTISFPLLVRRLMDTTSPSSYSEYRDIVDSMLETYRFEGDLLGTSNRLIEADLFTHVEDLAKEKSNGWRPLASGTCEACGKSIWAVKVKEERFEDPNFVVASSSGLEVTEKLKGRPGVRRRPSLKGKETDWVVDEVPNDKEKGRKSNKSIVVFRGGTACHAVCLEQGDRL